MLNIEIEEKKPLYLFTGGGSGAVNIGFRTGMGSSSFLSSLLSSQKRVLKLFRTNTISARTEIDPGGREVYTIIRNLPP